MMKLAYGSKSVNLILLIIVMIFQRNDCVRGNFVVKENSITILSPHDMRSKHDGSVANFGVHGYGGTSMVGSVVYPSKNTDSCKAFDGEHLFMSETGRPTILLVDRGNCYFLLKVWNAQQAGAAAVLIADDIDEPLITVDIPEDQYTDRIQIPTALITKSFGSTIKKALRKGDEVVLELDWSDMPNTHGRIDY